ncbi:MAG: 2-amino-4-hydroxy-6-hydroxymethyldihydropteridine diphosphokinase [Lachnospiraceae bacterium]
MDKIKIEKLTVFGNHGVYPEENVLGQKFLVSLVMHTDTRKAGMNDDLECSINYGDVSRYVKQFFEENTFKLIERVAEKLAESLLLRYSLLEKVDVKIEKPWAPIAIPVESVGVEISRGWHKTYIALGSNMGDKKGYLDEAVEKLKNHSLCQVGKVADYIQTEPYGGVEQDVFLNSALELRTLLLPEELLALLNQIEAETGRERTIHWGPRTLDLDILFYDDCIIDTPSLTVPHIDLQNRDFVLLPMAQIAPYYRHPVLGYTIGQLLDQLKKMEVSDDRAQ